MLNALSQYKIDLSACGLYILSTLYVKITSSLNTKNQWAKPRGMKNWRLLSSVNNTLTYFPNVDDD